jgi:hypothetical protein
MDSTAFSPSSGSNSKIGGNQIAFGTVDFVAAMRATGAWFSHGSRGSLKIHNRNARHGDRGSSNGHKEKDDAAAKVADEEIGLKVMVFSPLNIPGHLVMGHNVVG